MLTTSHLDQKEQCKAEYKLFQRPNTSPNSASKVAEERGSKLRQIDQWNTETIDLLMRLRRLLYKTVASWQLFVSKDARYLYQTGSLTNIGPDAVQTLVGIHDMIADLDRLHDELCHQLGVFKEGCVHEHEQHSRDVRSCLLFSKA